MELHSDGRNGDLAATRRRRHLYLLFDDWLWGLSVRKLDLSSVFYYVSAEEFPEPIARMEARHEFSQYITALPSAQRIIAMPLNMRPSMHHDTAGYGSLPIGQVGQTVVFDVRSRSLTFDPRPTMDLVTPTYIPVDDNLFVLSSDSFQVFRPDPSVDAQDGPLRGYMAPAAPASLPRRLCGLPCCAPGWNNLCQHQAFYRLPLLIGNQHIRHNKPGLSPEETR